MLTTHNLQKHFDGVYAVDSLSIDIARGKITSVIGPNGSGKTTLTNLLSGMLPIDGGFVMIGKEKLEYIYPQDIMEYGITRTFQDVRLFEQMAVLDNILVVLTERGIVSSLFEKHNKYHLGQAQEVLEKVGLWEKRHQLAVNLSYGQRKLLEIARVLAMKSEIYLFDEPFAGLFPEMRKVVVSVMKELRTEGKTLVLIEHNMDLIRELADQVIVMDAGKLLAKGEPSQVLSQKDVMEAYLGE